MVKTLVQHGLLLAPSEQLLLLIHTISTGVHKVDKLLLCLCERTTVEAAWVCGESAVDTQKQQNTYKCFGVFLHDNAISLCPWFSTFMIFDRSSGSCWHDSHIVTGSWQQQSIRELMEARRSQQWVMISKIISDSRRIFHLKWAQRGDYDLYDYVKSKWLSVTVILNIVFL